MTIDTLRARHQPRSAKVARSPTGTRAVADIEVAWDAVSRAANRSRAHDRLVARAGVSLDRAGWALLRQLDVAERALRPTDLAELLEIDPPWVTRKLQQLERAGLVVRSADDEDRRAFRTALTFEGRYILERLLQARHEQLSEILQDWDAQDLAAFAALLRRFATDISAVSERQSPSSRP